MGLFGLIKKCEHQWNFVSHDIKDTTVNGRPARLHIWVFKCKKCGKTKIQKHI